MLPIIALLAAAVLMLGNTNNGVLAARVVRQSYFSGSECEGTRQVVWDFIPSGVCQSTGPSTSYKYSCGNYQEWSESDACVGPSSGSHDYTGECNIQDEHSYTYTCVDQIDPVLFTLSRASNCTAGVSDASAITLVLDVGQCMPMVSASTDREMTMSYRVDRGGARFVVSYWTGNTACEGLSNSFPQTGYTTCAAKSTLPYWKSVVVHQVQAGAVVTQAPTTPPTPSSAIVGGGAGATTVLAAAAAAAVVVMGA